MSWPELLKAKNSVRAISDEIDRLLREYRSLNKKDIVQHKETLLAQIDESYEKIENEIAILQKNMKSHRKYMESKSVFLRRHHKMI